MSFYAQRHYVEKSAEENVMDRLLYLEQLAENRPGPQLDIGCSIGNFVNLDPGRIQGIDWDEEALKICNRRGLPCSRLDIVREELPWKDHFEAVHFRHVIEHMEDPRRVLEKIRGILKPGGLLIVETPDYVTAHHRRRGNFWDDYTHKTPFTAASLHRIAFDSGFEVRHAGHKPEYGYWTKKLVKSGRLSHATAFKWYARLNLVQDDLLFVFRKPEAP
jgi:SAM-dependent methyltransferase